MTRPSPRYCRGYSLALGSRCQAAGASSEGRGAEQATARWSLGSLPCPRPVTAVARRELEDDTAVTRGSLGAAGPPRSWRSFCRIHLAEHPSCLGPISLGSRWPVLAHGPGEDGMGKPRGLSCAFLLGYPRCPAFQGVSHLPESCPLLRGHQGQFNELTLAQQFWRGKCCVSTEAPVLGFQQPGSAAQSTDNRPGHKRPAQTDP